MHKSKAGTIDDKHKCSISGKYWLTSPSHSFNCTKMGTMQTNKNLFCLVVQELELTTECPDPHTLTSTSKQRWIHWIKVKLLTLDESWNDDSDRQEMMITILTLTLLLMIVENVPHYGFLWENRSQMHFIFVCESSMS